MTIRRSRAALIAASILSLPLAVSPVLVQPATAQWVVYDPTNYVQNVLSAARALEQINNQITSLQNEAQMLINQARNLASLPYSALQQLQQSVQRTQQLLDQAQRIAFDVQQIDQVFQTTYGEASLSASDQDLIAGARERWQNTVAGLQDAMRVQAGVVTNIDTNRAEMSALVGQSQGATGALQATQAGNQLLALQAQQLADLTAAAVDFAQEQSRLEAAAAPPQSRSAEASHRDDPANDVGAPRDFCPPDRAEDHNRRSVDPASQNAPLRVPPPASQPPAGTPAPKAPPEAAQPDADRPEAR